MKSAYILDLHKLEHNCIIREPNIIKQTSSENEILLSSDLKLVSQAMGLVITLDITGDILRKRTNRTNRTKCDNRTKRDNEHRWR